MRLYYFEEASFNIMGIETGITRRDVIAGAAAILSGVATVALVKDASRHSLECIQAMDNAKLADEKATNALTFGETVEALREADNYEKTAIALKRTEIFDKELAVGTAAATAISVAKLARII